MALDVNEAVNLEKETLLTRKTYVVKKYELVSLWFVPGFDC